MVLEMKKRFRVGSSCVKLSYRLSYRLSQASAPSRSVESSTSGVVMVK